MDAMIDLETPAVDPVKRFEEELGRHFLSLRRALLMLLEELGSPRTPSLLQRRLGVGYTICWQIFQITKVSDAAAAAQHTPSPEGLKRLLALPQASSVSQHTAESVQSASEEFRRFVKRHADDLASFDSMLVSSVPDDRAEKILIQRRRAAYNATSHVWGIQTDMNCMTMIVRRNANDLLDGAGLFIHRGIRRLRPDVQVTLMGYHTGSDNHPVHREPMDKLAAEQYQAPFLPEFCSKPMPRIERQALPSGWILHNLAGQAIGRVANFNCAFGYTVKDQPYIRDANNRSLVQFTHSYIRRPAALLVMDLVVHRPSFGVVQPERAMHPYHEGHAFLDSAAGIQPFPLDESVVMIGPADEVDLAEVPRYAEMLQYAAASADWNLREFDVYRLRIPYPVMGSTIRQYFYLNA